MEVSVIAADGARLAADLVAPPSPRRAALLAPALGVKRSFYAAFAEFLAEGGLAVLSLDYRGIGGSRDSGPRAVLHDWADLDLTAGLAELGRRFPGVPRVWFGHSIGGQLFGLVPDAPVERALFVAAQHGHWRNWSGWRRYAMAALWWGVIPGVSRLAGRLPMARFGRGEDLPPGVAREWARWGRDPAYAIGFAQRRGPSGFTRYAGPLRGYAIRDDTYAPPSTVRPLLEAFTATRGEYVEVGPERVGGARLGHFGAFRPSARPLWEEWRAWLSGA
jgi:predicted alpha/beta hydrolase